VKAANAVLTLDVAAPGPGASLEEFQTLRAL
jgi:hypothetical protein